MFMGVNLKFQKYYFYWDTQGFKLIFQDLLTTLSLKSLY
jgi:hypothetical protein